MRAVVSSLLFVFLSVAVNPSSYAKERNPCDRFGNLKGWARKAGLSEDVCSAGTEPVNTAPVVNILSPTDSASMTEGSSLTLEAAASDNEDGNLDGAVTWSSSIDGAISSTAELSAGTHTLIARVSDSGGLVATDEVTLTVTAVEPVTASVTLSWSIPDTRESGELLDVYEIGGYEIQYKKAGDPLYYSETVADAMTTQHLIADLAPGDYEFKIATYDTEGQFSQFHSLTYSIR